MFIKLDKSSQKDRKRALKFKTYKSKGNCGEGGGGEGGWLRQRLRK
jgi:hypothetical protein